MASSLAPREIAKHALERLGYQDPTELNLCSEVRLSMEALSCNVASEDRKRFVKSAAYQLSLLLQQLQKSKKHYPIGEECLDIKSHANQNLTDVEESFLCGVLMAQRQSGLKITLLRARQAAEVAFGGRGLKFGKNWSKGFKKRNTSIFTISKKRSMSKGRSDSLTYDQCEIFCDAMEDIVSDHEAICFPVHPDTLCNMDETLLRLTSNGRVELELVPRDERTGTASTKDTTVIGSMLVFVTASGVVPFVYFCMKKDPNARSYPVPKLVINRESRNGKVTTIYEVGDTWSETGYMKLNHIEYAVAAFGDVMKHYYPSMNHPVILLADNLRQHQDLDVLEILAKHRVLLQFLTPNASHFLQPLDDKLFAVFKKELERQYDQYDGSLCVLGLKAKNVLASVLPTAFNIAFTPLRVCESWANVGIWPYRRDLIMEHALKFTMKSMGVKYSKRIESPLKARAFELALSLNAKAKDTVLKHAENSFERTVGIQKRSENPKRNSATDLFQKTHGKHELHLEHERRERLKKAEKASQLEEKKKEQEERKRKREEEEDLKEKRKRERIAKKDDEMRIYLERKCQAQPCKFAYDPSLMRASMWLFCSCNKYYICPAHKECSKSSLLMAEHVLRCEKNMNKE